MVHGSFSLLVPKELQCAKLLHDMTTMNACVPNKRPEDFICAETRGDLKKKKNLSDIVFVGDSIKYPNG